VNVVTGRLQQALDGTALAFGSLLEGLGRLAFVEDRQE
jgi:hypothetical protein